jgi:phosphoribosyl-dephospho-CoA transferase
MPPRHSQVWPTACGWDAVQQASATQPPAVRDAVARWRAADWPLVVRRAEPDQAAGLLAVGLPLPPDQQGHKTRLGAVIDATAVRQQNLAPTLSAVMQSVPTHWRAALLALHLEWGDTLPPLRVYGSLAWQATTGMPYLRPTSDIDLLFYPQTRAQLERGTALLQAHGNALPLDGEVVFPGDVAVAWREWQAAMWSGGDGSVLAKRGDRVQLVSCKALLLMLELAARSALSVPRAESPTSRCCS